MVHENQMTSPTSKQRLQKPSRMPYSAALNSVTHPFHHPNKNTHFTTGAKEGNHLKKNACYHGINLLIAQTPLKTVHPGSHITLIVCVHNTTHAIVAR